MLEDAERTTIGSYGVSGIAMAYGMVPNYVEHASCHVTIDAFCQRNSDHLATCRMSGIPAIVNAQGRLVRYVPRAHNTRNSIFLAASAR